eukprot:jgi/Mesvir1/25519/Mv01769-RA.1
MYKGRPVLERKSKAEGERRKGESWEGERGRSHGWPHALANPPPEGGQDPHARVVLICTDPHGYPSVARRVDLEETKASGATCLAAGHAVLGDAAVVDRVFREVARDVPLAALRAHEKAKQVKLAYTDEIKRREDTHLQQLTAAAFPSPASLSADKLTVVVRSCRELVRNGGYGGGHDRKTIRAVTADVEEQQEPLVDLQVALFSSPQQGRRAELADFDEDTLLLAFYIVPRDQTQPLVSMFRFDEAFMAMEPACPQVELGSLSGSPELTDLKLLRTQRKVVLLDKGGRVRVYNIQQKVMEREMYQFPPLVSFVPTNLLVTATGDCAMVVCRGHDELAQDAR